MFWLLTCSDSGRYSTHATDLQVVPLCSAVNKPKPHTQCTQRSRKPYPGGRTNQQPGIQVPGSPSSSTIPGGSATDLTRVATFQFYEEGNNFGHPWLGVTEGHHNDLGYGDPLDLNLQRKIKAIEVWQSEQVAYLLDRLSQRGLPADCPKSRCRAPLIFRHLQPF